MAMIFCSECGKKISDKANQCPYCGCPSNKANSNKKQWWVYFILLWFLGVFGAHKYYIGKIGQGIAMTILTITLIGIIVTGIWSFIDFIIALCHAGNDKWVKSISEPVK
ncbi:MAG: TM2 domain-containing protein [Rickettsiales bacterium]|jgi:TM2 domain-containing membrane protein YozV|nr:TM2 domain-containing protein [Rickettsiales bacterium]